jgi:hypothetical protein
MVGMKDRDFVQPCAGSQDSSFEVPFSDVFVGTAQLIRHRMAVFRLAR